MIKILLNMMIILSIAGIGFAQVEQPPATESPDTAQINSQPAPVPPMPTEKKSHIRLSGDLGMYGEYYNISEGEARRPTTSGRIFLRPTLTLFGNFSASLDIIYSTEGSSARQSINQFAIHPKWSWGVFHAGDFSHELSNFTFSGTTIRGAGVELYPGLLRFQAIGGQSRRKVIDGPYNSVYSQLAYGFKLGIGKEDASYFDINVVKVKDDVNSLSPDLFQVDSLEVDTTYFPDTTGVETTPQEGVSPAENLVVGANTVIKLFQRRLTFKGEIAGSAYTRNLYSTSDISDEGIPSFMEKLFTVRGSSSFDYAYAAELSFNQRIFNVRGGYTYVGPGYTSLGLSSNINDKQIIEGGLGFRFLRNRIAIQGTGQIQQDNVADQKAGTTKRTTFNVNTVIRPVNQVSLALNMMRNIMKNDESTDTTWIKSDSVFNDFDSTWTEPDSVPYVGQIHNENISYSANAMYQFMMFNMNQSLNVNYSIQFSNDKNPTRDSVDVTTQNIMFSVMSMLGSSWSAAATANFNIIEIEYRDKTNQSCYGLSLTKNLFDGKLSNTLGFNLANSDVTDITGITFQSSYSITRMDMIRLSARNSMYNNSDPSTADYNEFIANIGYTHRF